jgi:hypothetical protein
VTVGLAVVVAEGMAVWAGGPAVGKFVAVGIGAAGGLGVQPERTRFGRNNKITMDLIIFDGCIVFLLA